MADLKLTDVAKTYGGTVDVLKNINLDIEKGELIVFVGPSGCGKSTTLRMLAGLESVSDGDITMDGTSVKALDPKDRDIAMVFQNYALYPHMSVYKNMAFALKLRKLPKAEIDKRVRGAAEILGIEHLLERKPKQLSGGQRQRVAVGRCIVREPKAFLFDEPLSNLDAKLRVTTRAELKKLHMRLKTTTIYVTHDQEEAMTLGDRVVVMADGIIQQAESPFEVYQNPVNRFVASFIGTPPMNFLDGTIERDNGAMWFNEGSPIPGEPTKQQRLRVSKAHEARLEGHVGKAVVMGLRPQLLAEAAYGESLDQSIAAGRALRLTVNIVEPMGDVMDASCSTDKHPHIVARVPAHQHMPVAEITTVAVDMEAVHFFEPGEFGANLTLHAGSAEPATA